MKISLTIGVLLSSLSAHAQTSPTAFAKFKGEEQLAKYLANNPSAKRLHKNLMWVEGVEADLLESEKRFSDGIVGFEPNREYVLPPTKTSTSLNNITPELWGITNINADKAWNKTSGAGVLVAVVDSGVNFNHASIANRIAVNTAEQAGVAGVDDDNNGYVDDVYGYDFFNKDSNPMDDNGHGSHVAGTIAGNNAKDNFWGVAPEAQILIVKTHNASGSGTEEAVVKGILYAIDRGAKVLNNSWGGAPEAAEYSQLLHDAIEYGVDKGALFIASSGNDSSDNDYKPSYPASYVLPNILSIGSSTKANKLSYFSNYGKETVHLAAPGSRVFSINYKGGYNYKDGTSMASPHVSGAAALIMSRFPDASLEEVKTMLLSHVRTFDELKSKVSTSGILDVKFLAE